MYEFLRSIRKINEDKMSELSIIIDEISEKISSIINDKSGLYRINYDGDKLWTITYDGSVYSMDTKINQTLPGLLKVVVESSARTIKFLIEDFDISKMDVTKV